MQNLHRIFLVLTLVILCGVNYIQSVAVSNLVWDTYKSDFGKKYATATEESNARYYFAYNTNLINNHNIFANSGRYAYWLKANQFTDMRLITFNALFPQTTQPTNTNATPLPTLPNVPTPNTFRPQANVGVTPNIEDQGVSCNSGWAYAAKGAIELWDAMQFGAAIPDPLSAQQLIDCAGVTSACINQVPQAAFDYLTRYEGINLVTRRDYGNNNASSTPLVCRARTTVDGLYLLKYSNQITNGDDVRLRQLIGNRFPVVTEFNPTSFEFMHYSRGLFTQPSTSKGSHYMIVVGYDETSWIIQNSFGVNWGESGYMRLSRNDVNAKLPKSATLPTE